MPKSTKGPPERNLVRDNFYIVDRYRKGRPAYVQYPASFAQQSMELGQGRSNLFLILLSLVTATSALCRTPKMQNIYLEAHRPGGL